MKHVRGHPGPRSGVHHTAIVGRHPEGREWVADGELPFFKPLIDEGAYIQPFVTIDGGCERPTVVGARTFVMAHVHIGHDALVGDDVEIAPHATLGGYAEVGNHVKIGIGAVVLPYRKIGQAAIIGAGAVVTKDVPAGATMAGNPAKRISRNSVPYTERPPEPPLPTPGSGLPETCGVSPMQRSTRI